MSTLMRELLALNEAKDINKANLEAIEKVLGFDGDYELGPKTRNQADKLGSDSTGDVFYVSLNPDSTPADCEAYVHISKSGKVSYMEFTHNVVALDGKIVDENAPRDWMDQLEDVIQNYEFESGEIKEGGVAAFYDFLKTVRQY